MSRLCIKNVPDYVNEARLKKHFETKGVVTDVKIIRNERGQSRKLAFIGFRSEKESKAALKYFNNTYIDTCKIVVEFAKKPGDESLPRPWSKYSQGSSAYAERHPDEKTSASDSDGGNSKKPSKPASSDKQKGIMEKLKLDQSDPKLQEFLSVMNPKAHDKFFWSNDDVKPKIDVVVKEVKKEKVASKKTGGDGLFLERAHVKFDDDESEDELYNEIPDTTRFADEEKEDIPEVKTDNLAYNAKVSDLDYLRSKMKKGVSEEKPSENEADDDSEEDVDEDDEEDAPATNTSDKLTDKDDSGSSDDDSSSQSSDSNMSENGKQAKNNDKKPPSANPFDKEQNRKELEKSKKDVSDDDSDSDSDEDDDVDGGNKDGLDDTGRLYVTNFPYAATEEELKKLFRRYGEVSEVHIAIDKDTKKSKGFAFIQYMIPDNAQKALKCLHNSIFEGRILNVLAAKKMPEKPSTSTKKDGLKSDFQRKKEEEKKKSANRDINWNTLFMSANAIADSIAHKYGMKKSDLLDASADNVAVRLALAETQIINETKAMLEEEGVSLEAFNGYTKKERSNSVILVKNIPFTTEESELRIIFEKFGNIGRLVLPPTKTLAIVEFLQPNDAKVAFRSLAYTKFKEAPLYLEWAPLSVFNKPAAPKQSQTLANAKKLQEDFAENIEKVTAWKIHELALLPI
eukprot:TRINITY_DN8561_c0_g1_i1.p1 TRINITY_DN8561_c0_g1~~TRINITY_DN8561_c0_g1_i1.p1  ORF type:complete len:683 (+),score=195.43 TRINITY_DN8561_c0_g1_i1:100-2148(+)